MLGEAWIHDDHIWAISWGWGGSLPPIRARACVGDSDPQDFSKSAEKLYSGVFWGVESKNDLRFDFWIDGWAVRLI